ncbi:hypothetical protein QQS21_006637 [Conoideocrella luteorostrata]|uniref:Inner kinetochore subunit AME1 domain-containing protein n=1 Tax=Conoideocrella luteorostrata TaxID=1105319 RepID=A0AAJ0FXU2_9HYPO|nr:hypothetical protein QQS21_006637 [Conoideocrella luteorostrata]
MAGRESRADRLNQRLRGAQRINVDDNLSFNLDLAGIAPGPSNIQSSSSPGTTAQRNPRPDDVYESPAQPVRRTSQDLPDHGQDITTEEDSRSRRRLSSSIARPDSDEPDELDAPELMRPPSSAPPSTTNRIQRRITEEVTESPKKQPGSGKRQQIPITTVPEPPPPRPQPSSSSEPEPRSSSPTIRKVRRSDGPARTGRPSVPAIREEPERPQAPPNRTAQTQRQRPSPEDDDDEGSEESDHSDREAVEIHTKEAARIIGHKRPRTSLTATTSSGPDSEDESARDSPSDRSAPKRRRGSPATQRQPIKRSKQQQQQAKYKKKRHSSSSDQNDDVAIEITVQRFINNYRRDGDDEDELQQEIPFANRGGETVVDVFAQVCEEVISTVLDQLQQVAETTEDADKKKECRIKMRAIRAYREELNSRLLQHAIHLNHWHSLRRRLRHVQKEKLALRDEIIRLKSEREQVALRMDAIRIKHEADSKESTSRLNASAIMYDIDLAVEQGREAPELSRAAEKKADLGNLDLILAQLSDQVSSTSSTGGLLQQVRDFNAFLERAVSVLEPRPNE